MSEKGMSADDEALVEHLTGSSGDDAPDGIDDDFVPEIPDDPDLQDVINVMHEQNDSINALKEMVKDQQKMIQRKNEQLARQMEKQQSKDEEWRTHVTTTLERLSADESVTKSNYFKNLTPIEQAVEMGDRDVVEERWGASMWRATRIFRVWDDVSVFAETNRDGTEGYEVVHNKGNSTNLNGRSDLNQQLAVQFGVDWQSTQLKRALKKLATSSGSESTTKNNEPAWLGGTFELFKRHRDGQKYWVCRLAEPDDLTLDPAEDV